jgi:hypothetical protein
MIKTMNKVTFTGSNVMSDEMANQTGNISRKLFSTDNALVRNRRPPVGMGAELAQTNPFAWNSEVPGETTDEMLTAYLQQVRLSAYYQNNPLPVLEYSTKYGVQEPLGGPLRKQF